MNNRFGMKELVVSGLLVALIVSVWLAMKQFDRQWDVVQSIQATLKDQNNQLQKLNKQLAASITVRSSRSADTANGDSNAAVTPPAARQTRAPQGDSADPFYRLRAARKLPGYARGGWLIESFHDMPGKLTPVVTNEEYSSIIQGHIFQSLAQRDPDTLKWKPLIARDWQKSKDGMTFTFDLRHDVTFSDGRPLTSADVVYTYNLIMNPQLGDPWLKGYYATIKDVKAAGTYRVVFTMSKPYFQGFGLCAGMQILPKHFYRRYSPDQITQAPGLVMGTGPYQLQEGSRGWKPGSGQIVLVRNPNYWGLAPGLDRIVYKIISDDTARLTAFTNGELDLFSPQPEQFTQLKTNQAVRAQAHLFTFYTATAGYRYIGWNQQRGGKPTLFADRRVRQAMTMLIDRRRMCDRLMEGLARPVTGPFNPLSDQYNHNVKPWPYDPARASKLLREAGYYDRNGDGVIDGPDGKPFEFKFIYPAQMANYQHMALYLKDAYAQAGIILDPDPLPFPVMIQRMQQRDFTAISLGWGGTIESDPYQIFDSHSIGQGGDDYVHYVNHKLDKLIEKARMTPNIAMRMKMWHQVHRILHEDQPYTFLFMRKAIEFVSKRVQNVKLTGKLGLNSSDEWFIKKADRKWEN